MTALADKSAIITGGASGIGLAIARLFAAEGARVGVIDRTPCPDFASATADVTDPDALAQAVASLEATNGPATILVTAAGIDEVAPLEDVTLEAWTRMLTVHMTGTFLATQLCLPGMKAAGWGRIITLASQLGHRGAPGMVPYCAAKSGIVGFTKALAHEVAEDGITVNWQLGALAVWKVAGDAGPAENSDVTTPLHELCVGLANAGLVVFMEVGGDLVLGRPSSHISSTLRPASCSRRRLD